MKTKVINIYGGPGSGKSTLAAGIFHELKSQGHSAELVTEFVKDWAYEEKKIDWYHQIMILAQQLAKEALIYNKVEYIVTDSPVFLSMYYEQYYKSASMVTPMQATLLEEIKKRDVEVINLYLPSTSYSSYNPKGRYQSHEEAIEIHDTMLEWLKKNFDFVELWTRNSKEIVEILLNG